MNPFLAAALDEARRGREEGGIPIGSVLVIDDRIVGRGRNRRVQEGSVIKHAEMDCLENAGRMASADYGKATLYSTLSPCHMCTGAILLYGIPTVVVGEARTFQGPGHLLFEQSTEVVVLDDDECVNLMTEFIAEHPDLWNEDIGI